METIDEIFNSAKSPDQVIALLKNKSIYVPSWGKLMDEFDPRLHPVMNKTAYPDVTTDEGIQPVTRVAIGLQRLAVKRMTELVSGIPVKRIYKPENDRQKEVAAYLEKIFMNNRIDSVNVERCNMLFAGCEVMTLWYAVEQVHSTYGFKSNLKFRCRNFTPMMGDELYPLFDEDGDMIAMSVAYRRKNGKETFQYFDCYTDKRHIKWSTEQGEWAVMQDEEISLMKIPCIYTWRPTPIWEDTSNIVSEIEWALSRNGNYLRENSKPLFVVFSDEQISYGDEKSPNKEFRSIMQYPQNGTAQYVTWAQATESLKYHTDTLRNLFFTSLQLPDWSYEKMSQQALSGESRKQLFIDSQLKVKDEAGRLIEFFDREINVVKAFLKVALGDSYADDIDALEVETQITPFTITDEADTIKNLITANGGEAIISQRESIEQLGWSDDVDKTLQEIQSQKKSDIFDPTV